MNRIALGLILSIALAPAFAQDTAPATTETSAQAAAPEAPVTNVTPARGSKKAPKEDRMINGTMVAGIALGIGAVAAAAGGGGGGDDKPSSP